MESASENSRRIARNTLMLYVRMLFVLAVGLYTSRVVLNALGVSDYGVYNVVGGFVGMFSFLQASLGAATSRYITFDLGKGDMAAMKRTFGNIQLIHLVLAGLVFLVAETLGLWFVMEKLNIPPDRYAAAMWVYQYSILTTAIGICLSPYIAGIIAHEKMSVFAYISIFEAVSKLVIVYLLVVSPFDRLITYASLLVILQCITSFLYWRYGRRNFEETHTPLRFDKPLFKEIFAFAGWTLNGNLAVMGYTQGLNVVLNLFFGPIVNAARGIAVQVQNIAQSFCSNFQMAINPQITKSYAQNDLNYMHKLIITSSKFSFFILFFIALPLSLEAGQVLHWWLGIVPDHTVNFLRLILCTSLLYTLSNPIIMSVHATGRLKKFQLIEGSMLLSIVPIAYLLLKYFHVPPESVFMVHIAVELCTQYVRLRIVLPMIQMDLQTYFRQVISRILPVVVITSILPWWIHGSMDSGILSFFVVCVSSVICLTAGIYWIGCTREERIFAKTKLQTILNRIR